MAGDELKHDLWKPRFELIDEDAEKALAMVLTAGAIEYKEHGWYRLNTAEGRERIIGSLMRHLNAYRREHRDGVAFDKQFGLPHSAHLLACAMFLATFDVWQVEEFHPGGWKAVEIVWEEALKKLQQVETSNTLFKIPKA